MNSVNHGHAAERERELLVGLNLQPQDPLNHSQISPDRIPTAYLKSAPAAILVLTGPGGTTCRSFLLFTFSFGTSIDLIVFQFPHSDPQLKWM